MYFSVLLNTEITHTKQVFKTLKRNQMQCKGKHCKGNVILTQPFLILYLTYSCYSSIRRLRKAIIFKFKICSTPEVLNIRLWFCRSFVCPWWALLGGFISWADSCLSKKLEHHKWVSSLWFLCVVRTNGSCSSWSFSAEKM